MHFIFHITVYYKGGLTMNTFSNSMRQPAHSFSIKDPGSAITHFIAMIASMIGAVPLLIKAAENPQPVYFISMSLFISSMILLYAASTSYHSFNLSLQANRLLKKIDHMMISILIAGTYTPVCLIALKPSTGTLLCLGVWGMALLGILLKAFWIYCPRWISSVLYIAMGWLCIFAMGQLWSNLPREAFYWLLSGGIFYTVGGIIYALKLPLFNSRHRNFGSHEIFHLFVMAGSFCHYVMMYCYLVSMPLVLS